MLCEAAGECDGSKIVYAPTGMPAGCTTVGTLPPPCPGGTSAWTEVDLGADCLFEQDYTCYPDARCSCSHASMQWDEQWRLFRRLSLLPFVERLDCELPF